VDLDCVSGIWGIRECVYIVRYEIVSLSELAFIALSFLNGIRQKMDVGLRPEK
jgi:hypothetical protein